MFSFLYLLGPGVISWLVRRYFSGKDGKGIGYCLWQMCEILAYAMIVMTLTTAILEPSGGVSVAVLANGMLTVQYGTRALALAAALAAALGVLSAAGAEKLVQYRQQLVVTGVVMTAALCILVYGAGAPVPDGNMQVSTKPIRINNVYYDSNTPVYINDDQEYFFQVRSLAEWLGIVYEEKQTGLFQIRCSLGADTFTLDLLKADEDYFKKDGELYVSFSRLKSLAGINIRDNAVLADGSSRQVIYIDNYAQTFNYDWIQYAYAAHALGGIGDGSYTNLREEILQNYYSGQRVFEAELLLTADGALAVQGKDTSLAFTDLAKLMKKYPDIYLVTDTKETEKALVTEQFAHIVKAGNQADPEILKRIVPKIYNEEMFDVIMGIYSWNSMIYAIHAPEDFSEKEAVDFAYQRGIGVIAIYSDSTQELFFHELYDRDIKVYM